LTLRCWVLIVALLGPAGSAEALGAPSQERLSATLGFDAADLSTNRAGALTLHQRPWGMLLLWSVLSLSSVGLSAAWLRSARGIEKPASRGLVVLMIVAFCGAALTLCLSLVLPAARDVMGGEACRVDGALQSVRWIGKNHRNQAKLELGSRQITGVRDPSELEVGRHYRVYYSCHTGELASVEPL